MDLIIGSYRKKDYISRCLRSISEFVTGVDRIMVVDDSGDHDFAVWLVENWPVGVIETGGIGYNGAMKAVLAAAPADEPWMFVEEDFTFLAETDTDMMAYFLKVRPYLAQLALLRGPHFPIEHAHGGVLAGLEARLGANVVDLQLVEGLWEQKGTFTCNPAMWQAGISKRGWPDGKWSEDTFRDELLLDHYSFGFIPGVRVEHDGVRSGYDY